ncbi:hypothetical protein GUJ93_ZPchr0001g32545 [Zizania palustris]|uniref:Uncharacterized protein n=1 Tax=Zizania palustris TaxID=103762 RepID=A0A8J5RNW2_ZIZPA|nr:hypothetical protein GUJ93_ZPchr0001g32545 [Zizania palustris]
MPPSMASSAQLPSTLAPVLGSSCNVWRLSFGPRYGNRRFDLNLVLGMVVLAHGIELVEGNFKEEDDDEDADE